MPTISFETNARRLAEDLDRFAKKALPHAIRAGLNASAFEGRREWQKQLGAKLVIRNSYTQRSLRVEKANGIRIEGMAAYLGSPLKSLGDVEGGKVETSSRKGLAIPTAASAGQAPGTKPRTKVIRRPNFLSAIKLGRAKGRIGKSQQQKNAIAIAIAARTGSKFAYVETENRRGIVRVTGRKRLTVRFLYDTSKKSVRVRAFHTLEGTLKAIEPRLPIIHWGALLKEAQRHKILGY